MKKRKLMLAALFAFLFCLLFSWTAGADMGPKPEITIIVENPPQGVYYLDLLVPYDSPNSNNLTANTNTLDSEKLSLLKNYQESGWRAGLAYGTDIPMSGELTGKQHDAAMVHTFGYLGVPDNFKIIIISPDNQVYVSPEIHRNTYQTKITFDYDTHEIFQRPLSVSYLLQFAVSFGATIIVEGIILLLFRFSLKRNWKPFLLINFITQLLLTAVCGTVLFRRGLLSSYFMMIPLELIILIIETIACTFFLKPYSPKRKIAYAVTANIASFIAGWILLSLEFVMASI